MIIQVSFGKEQHMVEVPNEESATLGELKQLIFQKTNILPENQKLLGKPKLQTSPPDMLLTALGFKPGSTSKLMLIGSTSAQQAELSTSADTATKKVIEQQKRLLHQLPYNFWVSGCFGGLLADAYVAGRGSPLEGTNLAFNMAALDQVLHRINPFGPLHDGNKDFALAPTFDAASESKGGLSVSRNILKKVFSTGPRSAALRLAHGVMHRCATFAFNASQANSPEEVLQVVEPLLSRLEGLSVREWVMIPGGWRWKMSENIVFLLITREGKDAFKVVVVNRGKGGEQYHRRWQTEDKVKICPLLTLHRVEQRKMLDRSFWVILLSLWMRLNDPKNQSEFIREEVFYDVLLPWLAQETSDALEKRAEKTDDEEVVTPEEDGLLFGYTASERPNEVLAGSLNTIATNPSLTQNYMSYMQSCGCTSPRSGSGTVKSALTAFCFLLDEFSDHQLSAKEVKLVKFAIKIETFLIGAEELLIAGRRVCPKPEYYFPPTGAQKAKKIATLSSTASDEGEETLEAKRFRFEKVVGTSSINESGLAQALDKMEKTGVKDLTTSSLTLSQLFKAAEEENIIVTRSDNVLVTPAHFENKLVLVYVGSIAFQQFSELLAKAAPTLLATTLFSVELLFISADNTKEDYAKHCDMFSFPRAKFPALRLLPQMDLVTVPELLLFSPTGVLLHRKGVEALKQDPEASTFPLGGDWRGVTSLSYTDHRLLGLGAGVVSHHCQKRLQRSEISPEEVEEVLDLLDSVSSVVELMPRNRVVSLYDRGASSEDRSRLEGAEETGANDDGEVKKLLPSSFDTQGQVEVARNNLYQSILGSASLRDALSCPLSVNQAGHTHAELLPWINTANHLGKAYSSSIPFLTSIFKWERATNFSSLHQLLKVACQTIRSLWKRAGHSSTSSRVAEQMHIIELITWVLIKLVPLPQPGTTSNAADFPDESPFTSTFYLEDVFSPLPTPNADNEEESAGSNNASTGPDMQFEILNSLLYLTLSLANAWQAVETPLRSFDSERCLMAMHLLVVFDAVLRRRSGSQKCVLLSNLLHFDGGYYPSTSMGMQGVPFETLSATLEFTRPEMLPIRSAILRYLRYLWKVNKAELFSFPMPGSTQLEVSRGSHSVRFLRLFLDNAEISIADEQDNPMQSEIEKLMMLFCDAKSSLAVKFPEFIMLRNMVFLTKFLGTMETRDSHLLVRRKELDRFASWRLSFEESTPGRQMSAGWRTNPREPLWECIRVRGRDMDIADVRVTGFGGRELYYGEGLALISPIDVGRLMEMEHPTEDDILHTKTLHSFGGSLNQEEAETLLSFLTIPYMRIPLVLDFFATCDRNSHLFVKEVQDVLRAVLFEPSVFSPEWKRIAAAQSLNIPLHREELPKMRDDGDAAALCDESQSVRVAAQSYLGTTYGLLLNELAHDPHAVLEPLLSLLQQASAIAVSSVYSVHASYILFLVEIICDVLEFARHALTMSSVPLTSREVLYTDSQHLYQHLELTTHHWFTTWLRESAENDDTATQCVLLNIRGMIDRVLWKGLNPNDVLRLAGTEGTAVGALEPSSVGQDEEKMKQRLLYLLQSCAFVRSHHGFGMGLQRTQLSTQQGDEALTPEQNLLRFLQAQGLRTPATSSGDLLDQVKKLMLCGGRRRAVFLQITNERQKDTVRLPNLFRHAPQSTQDARGLKLPPADVAENRVFHYLLDCYHAVLAHLQTLGDAELSAVMEQVVSVVLGRHDRIGASSGGAAVSPSSAAGWNISVASDVLVGPPSSGLVFHLQTGELFWRKKELKPVPDSMSHFSDYESILGKELRQCGEVMRHTHRHWVHVVGSPYDLMEWTAPELEENKGGERCPAIIGGDWPKTMVESALYNGIVFDRVVAVGEGKGQVPWPVQEERWGIELVRQVLENFPNLKVFPLAVERPDDERHTHASQDISEMRFVLNDGPQYNSDLDRATWKEIVAHKHPHPFLEIYNLVSHARRMYRSLVYTSDQRYSLHSLNLKKAMARSVSSFHALAFQAGDFTERVRSETTLEIHRYNELLKGREMYLPPRLLQGVIPGVLLEVFTFWQGEDDIIRGYGHKASNDVDNEDGREMGSKVNGVTDGEKDPTDTSLVIGMENGDDNSWHRFSVEVFLHRGKAFLVRRNDCHYTPIWDHLPHHREQTPSSSVTEEWSRNVALLRAAVREPYEVCDQLLRERHGDVNAALSFATDKRNGEEIQRIRNEITSASATHVDPTAGLATPSTTAGGTSQPNLRLRDEDQVLIHLHECKGLRHLFTLVCGLEDASHTLVWGHRITKAEEPHANGQPEPCDIVTVGDEQLQIDVIEFSRLRARFLLQHEGGVSSAPLHLFLADYPGWRLAEPEDLHSHALAKLCELRETFQQSLVLCNGIHEVGVMVPNHTFSPHFVQGDCFNPYLLFDRSNFSWQQAAASPFYLYTLHPCGSIVIPQTLSASLYLAALQCGTQHYSKAITTLESCYTDTAFNHEESFMCDLFQFTESDKFPDAYAVRLKLIHALQHSPNKYAWMLLNAEVDHYLQMISHVSADCRLHATEVMDLIQRCSEPTPLIRSQLELHAARQKYLKESHALALPPTLSTTTDDSAASGSGGDLKELRTSLTAPPVVPCGLVWDRLLLHPWGRVAAQRLHRVTYLNPSDLNSPTKLIEHIWKDTLLNDEESGANTRLGFFFLYNLKVGSLTAKMGKDDCSKTFSEIMSRWFHLRHARWGREHTDAGEHSLGPSFCATVLQLMALRPDAPWPKANLEREGFILRRGLNLGSQMPDSNSIEGRLNYSSTIPELFRKIEKVAEDVFTGELPEINPVRQRRALNSKRYTMLQTIKHVVQVVQAHPGITRMIGRVQHKDTEQSVVNVPLYFHFDYLKQQTPSSSASSSGFRICSSATVKALCTQPLLELEALRTLLGPQASPHDGDEGKDNEEPEKRHQLPFDLRSHPLASSSIARTMLDRLEKDFELYSAQERENQRWTSVCDLSCLSSSTVQAIICSRDAAEAANALRTAGAALTAGMEELRRLWSRDQEAVSGVTREVLRAANDFPQSRPNMGLVESLREHRLKRYHRDRVPMSMEWLCGGLLSSGLEEEVQYQNPFHAPVDQIRAGITLLMLLSNRSHLAMQALAALEQVRWFLELCRLLRGLSDESVGVDSTTHQTTTVQRTREMHALFALEISPRQLEELLEQVSSGSRGAELTELPFFVTKLLQSRLQHLTSSARQLLSARRFYVTHTSTNEEEDEQGNTTAENDDSAFSLDPRFLIMEFLFSILLRRRQVEMTRWFIDELREGRSRVQQMIMGQGKTSVVAPLLALILADGKQLVTQVMPTALVEQTRAVLRRCFGVVIVKHVFTLQFDRSRCDDGSWDVEALLTKLQSAVKDRAVVVAAPESLKSLFLKYIEQLHLLESSKAPTLAGKDQRSVALAMKAQQREVSRARVVDAIAPILALWRDGVLLMDEVDVLLHPLRSELNFPVGMKDPIDMSGPRWTLPIHLLDLLCEFKLPSSRQSSDPAHFALLFAVREYQKSKLKRETKNACAKLAGVTSGFSVADEEDLSGHYVTVIHSFHEVLLKGVTSHALQREPHLVLLDLQFYKEEMLPLLITWAQLWIYEEFHTYLATQVIPCSESWKTFHSMQTTTQSFLVCEDRAAALQNEAFETFVGETPAWGIKLLHLAHDWLHRLLPHVLAKINRVSFGLLQMRDIRRLKQPELMPLSRQLTAVPFVAKDVPSMSSEFAHPDVAIGLTILAFRYEGLRLRDTRSLLQELKKEFSQQLGPKEQRPAALLYQLWVQHSDLACGEADSTTVDDNEEAEMETKRPSSVDVVPLSQLQLTDAYQLHALHQRLRRVPDVVYHYLSSHVFPKTMLFHRLKISACGHELGSSMIFGRRLGFSGTPSNLLPIDLGECEYEAGSDARVLSVLTDPEIVSTQVLMEDWSPLRVLDTIAGAQPPFYALIDAGALITNMNNSDVAAYLLARLPQYLFDGVVYLDDNDRQMVLQRSNGIAVPVAQCGIPISRRFTFFDQVHTTGTDVKQAPSANAVLTLGKDLTFRDYAQSAYRMRGIGNGQRLCLYLIPEVVVRMKSMLVANVGPSGLHTTRSADTFETGDLLRDVPAWLMLNSMKVESLQFLKLSLQELANVWRKKAYGLFLSDSLTALQHPEVFTSARRAGMFRVERPLVKDKPIMSSICSYTGQHLPLPSLHQMALSIKEFREVVAYPIADSVEAPRPFQSHVSELVAHHPALFAPEEEVAETQRIRAVVSEVERRFHFFLHQSVPNAGGSGAGVAAHSFTDLSLNAEMVHEQEAEEEQQQEAEEEQQRITLFSRDDEKPMPWKLETLKDCGGNPQHTLKPTNGACFYQLREFSVYQHPSGTKLAGMPPHYLISDNYFRLEWSGMGERRLKNALSYVEWMPSPSSSSDTQNDQRRHPCYGLLSLIEAESLRWLLHRNAVTAAGSEGTAEEDESVFRGPISLRLVGSGRCIGSSTAFKRMSPSDRQVFSGEIKGMNDLTEAALLFRFLNNEMFFTKEELTILENTVLGEINPSDRLNFFKECLRCRRRVTQNCVDTPVSVLFFSPEDIPYRRQLSCMMYMQTAFEVGMVKLLERAELQSQGRNVDTPLSEECAELENQLEEFNSAVLRVMTAQEEGAAMPIQVVASLLKEYFPHATRTVSVQDLMELMSFTHWKREVRRMSAQEASAGGVCVPNELMNLRSMSPPAVLNCVSLIPLSEFFELFPWASTEEVHRRVEAHLLRLSLTKAENEPWSCPTCTLRNDPGMGSCAVCGTLRPVTAVTGAEEQDAPWACEVCTFINDSRRQTVCSICLSPNPRVLEEANAAGGIDPSLASGFSMCPDGFWVCSLEHGGCSKMNPDTEYYCSACEKGRPGLSHVRF